MGFKIGRVDNTSPNCYQELIGNGYSAGMDVGRDNFRMKHILFIVDTFAKGGAGRVVSEISSEMFKKGEHVIVCTFGDNGVLYPLASGMEHIDGSHIGKKLKPSFVEKIKFIRRIIKAKKIEIIISFLTPLNVVAILAGLFAGSKVIISERNNPEYDKCCVRDRMLRKLIYRYADGFVFQTEEIQNWFSSSIRQRACIIENPINPLLPPPYFGVPCKKIVMAGRLNAQKNYPMAINAFAQISAEFPDYQLEIFGAGHLEKDLQQMINEKALTDRILLRGHSNCLFDEIKDASLYLMTSDYEGMSNSLMEAMGMGLAVITTDHGGGGARSLITDDVNGILVPVGDVGMLVEKMRIVLKDNEKRMTLAKNAFLIRNRFSIERITEKWQDYLEDVISRP